MTVRTRFAPSPTGYLHIGGVRTALFNWLLAKRHGGQFILRIDDTDQERHVEEAVAKIVDGFRWLDMLWDEGPEVGGPHGPYYQSQRQDLYRAAVDKLVAAGRVYRDYSTDAERDAGRDAAKKAKQAYRFRRVEYSDADLKRFEDEGRPYALRFEVPTGRTLVLNDLVKGEVSFNTDEIGDFVVVRPGGQPLYNFASIVDDVDMKITHVVRAEEHLSNTFPQLLVLEALGATPPAFAHVPYVAEPGSHAKMSKRKTEEYEKRGILIFLHQYIERGYLPHALINYLARLGWSFDDTQELFTRAELIEKFSLDRVNSSPASLDPDKLFWIEGHWMKEAPMEDKVAGAIPFLAREGLASEPISDEVRALLEAVILALGDRMKTFSDVVKLGRFFFEDEIKYDPDAVKKRLRKPGVPEMLRELDALLAEAEPYDLPTLEKAVHDYAEKSGRKMGDVVNPLRVATTGQGVGPGLYDCLFLVGRDRCRARIAKAIEMLEAAS
ncbi:glutamate--tRNA ligase [Paludisphaera sp.]|uniref:glutamate--tRNA ligase n=1 Tax=Paludisphaera sp. TaxID=2017432 RepID=UPI00301C327B